MVLLMAPRRIIRGTEDSSPPPLFPTPISSSPDPSFPYPSTPRFPTFQERLNRVALVKPDVAKQIEGMIVGAVQRGLRGQVSEAQIIQMLEKVGGGAGGENGPKITFMRRKGFDEDDDDF